MNEATEQQFRYFTKLRSVSCHHSLSCRKKQAAGLKFETEHVLQAVLLRTFVQQNKWKPFSMK
jgi:hypothetical protein